MTLFCSIANVNRKNYYSFLNQKEKTDDDELIEFIVTTQRKHHFGIVYRTMTSMIKNHNKVIIFKTKINCGKTSPALPQLSAVKKIKLN